MRPCKSIITASANDLVADFFSGSISVSWRKLHVFIGEDRRSVERETVWEWFQWLAEQMIEREKKLPPTPAHVAHRQFGVKR